MKHANQEGESNAESAPPRGRPAVPDQSDRTAGGIGGAAPASLDLYGQSSIQVISFNQIVLPALQPFCYPRVNKNPCGFLLG